MSKAKQSADFIRRIQKGNLFGPLGEILRNSNEPVVRQLGEKLVDYAAGGPEAAQKLRAAQRAAQPTRIGEEVRDAGGITMGQRSVPTRADLGAAPEPDFPVPAGSPQIRRLQQLRREIGPTQGPRESTSADYIFQPAIRGMRNPAGMEAPGTMFSSTGRVTEPGTKIGGRMMAGEYPSSPRRTVIRETEVEVSPGQMEMNIAPGKVRMKQGPEGPMLGPKTPPVQGPQINVVDEMRPRGVQLVDFGSLTKKLAERSPAEKAALLTSLGLGGTLLAVGNMPRGERPMTQEPRETAEAPLEPSIQPPAPAPAPAPVMSQEESGALDNYFSEVLAAAQQTDPSSSSAIRALAPRSPENYGSLAEYNTARADFARALERGGRFNQMVEAAQARVNEADREGIAQFAKNFPQLVYADAVNRMGSEGALNMVAPEMNQQSRSVTTPTFGSSLGTNNEANALGQANAAASQVYTGDFNNDLEATAAIQKNNELIAAAAPIEYGNLQRPDQFLGEQLAMRMAGRFGGMA